MSKTGRPGLAVTSITWVKRATVVTANFLKLLKSIQSSQHVGLWHGPITSQRCDRVQVSLLSLGFLLGAVRGDACASRPPGEGRWWKGAGICSSEGRDSKQAGNPLTICSLIWEHGAFLFSAAKPLAKALLTAQFLCRACCEVPSSPATARHTGGSLARAWNRLLSSSLASRSGGETGALGGSWEIDPQCFLLICFLNHPLEAHAQTATPSFPGLSCQMSFCFTTNAISPLHASLPN